MSWPIDPTPIDRTEELGKKTPPEKRKVVPIQKGTSLKNRRKSKESFASIQEEANKKYHQLEKKYQASKNQKKEKESKRGETYEIR